MADLPLHHYTYDEIHVGKEFEFKRLIIEDDVKQFAELTGDYNPLHCDEEYAKTTVLKKRIVHGMLAASLFSTLLGMICPGKTNLYLTQSLHFRFPIPLHSEVTVRGRIKEKTDSIKVITIATAVLYNGSVAISGEAKVKVLEG